MNKASIKFLRALPVLALCCTMSIGCSQPSGGTEPTPAPESSETPETPEEETVYTIDNIRDYVVGVDEPVELADGTSAPLINFDNAATTPPMQPVADAVEQEMKMYGSIGRGFSAKSNHSTDIYMETRQRVMKFVNADPDINTCFYVNSTTDGLNKLASALAL